MTRNSLRGGASRAVMAACLLALAPLAGEAFAQDAPAQAEANESVSEVVVTGSLIRGAREDGPVSVEVFSSENLEEIGAPNPVEFSRSLTQSSEALGEGDINSAATSSGRSTVNLRGLGSARTMVLLNGHRTSSDTSFLPMNAIQRVEVLKDGAGVTYGAGAVAGVINFVTRNTFDGLEVSASHKFIQGSKGESDISVLYGKTGDRGNFMLSAMYAHQSELNFTDRSYGLLPWDVNPTQYLEYSANPGQFLFPTPDTSDDAPEGALNWTPANDFSRESCSAVGGVQPNNTTRCFYTYTPFFNLVDEQKNLRLFASADFDITDTMQFHAEAGYSKTSVPTIWAAPTLPPIGSHRGVMGEGETCSNSVYYCQYDVPISNAGVRNPFIDEFYARNLPGQTAPATGRLLTSLFWEPFAFGGNMLFPGGTRQESRTSERTGVNMRVRGEFSADSVLGFLDGITYEYAFSAGQTRTVLNRRDIVTSRLQNALRGYGGADCAAVDDVATDYTNAATYDATVGTQSNTLPGSEGCQWFNPFASAWETSMVNHTANPSYGGQGYENSRDLLDWMIAERPTEARDTDFNLDILYTGQGVGFALPGGEISWALGGQWRKTADRSANLAEGDEEVLATQQCPWPDSGVRTSYQQLAQQPGQIGCDAAATPGAFWGTGYFTPNHSEQEIYSYFGELRLPIWRTVDMQLALRREEYGAIAANTYKVATKWQALPWLGFRASYSTNYAPPPSNISNSDPVVGSSYQSRFTTVFPTLTDNIPGIKPEEAVVKNAGVMVQTERFGANSYFTANLDYFNFDISGQIVSTSVTTVLLDVVPPAGSEGIASPVNCSARLIDFATLNTPCVQGVTTANNITQIKSFQTNGPGMATSGFDLGVNYSKMAFGGDISTGFNATLVTDYEVAGYSVNGVVFDEGGDRLGYSNASRSSDFSSELRGNVFAGYRRGRHGFRAQVNYTKGVKDELGVPTSAPKSTFGVFPKDYIDLDLNYRFDVPWTPDTEFRLTILNVTDEDPMPAQVRNSYYSGVGNPRGRQIEVGLTKKF